MYSNAQCLGTQGQTNTAGKPRSWVAKVEGTALSAVLRGARIDQGSGCAMWNKKVFQPQRFSGRNCVLSGLVENAAHEISARIKKKCTRDLRLFGRILWSQGWSNTSRRCKILAADTERQSQSHSGVLSRRNLFYVGKTLHLFVFNPGPPQCQACQEARTDAEGEAGQSVSTWMDFAGFTNLSVTDFCAQ